MNENWNETVRLIALGILLPLLLFAMVVTLRGGNNGAPEGTQQPAQTVPTKHQPQPGHLHDRQLVPGGHVSGTVASPTWPGPVAPACPPPHPRVWLLFVVACYCLLG